MRTCSPCYRSVSPRTLRLSALVLVGLAALFVARPSSALVTIDWVPIGNPGNAADTPLTNCFAASCGSVSYAYQISKYEVTNAQYAEFLNAKAASDPLGLYNLAMGLSNLGGITRSGSSGSFGYAVTSGFASKPVNFVSFYDTLRFSNWLNNGQGAGDTETGAYTLLGGTAIPTNGTTLTRNAEASIVLPSENEWYKAAFYDAVSTSYFDYPAGTNLQIVCATPTANRANCFSPVLTNVGAYTGSASPYGTYDQGGNVSEWSDESYVGNRVVRGGSLYSPQITHLGASSNYGQWGYEEVIDIGFRVASISEPGTGLLVMTGLAGLAVRRRRSAQAL